MNNEEIKELAKLRVVCNSQREELERLKEFRMPHELHYRLESIEETMHSFLLLLTNKRQAQSKKARKSMSRCLRQKILDRDNRTCQNCKKTAETFKEIKLHIDHIIPVDKGGTDDENNLQVLCSSCNLLKKNYIFWPIKKAPAKHCFFARLFY